MKRTLTKQEEQVIRLCHHDFESLSTFEAGKRMGISQRRVQQLLQDTKLKAPQMFPLLTFRQRQIRDSIIEDGLTFKQITKKFYIQERRVAETIEVLKKKGVYLERRKPTVRYENWMDNKIKQKF